MGILEALKFTTVAFVFFFFFCIISLLFFAFKKKQNIFFLSKNVHKKRGLVCWKKMILRADPRHGSQWGVLKGLVSFQDGGPQVFQRPRDVSALPNSDCVCLKSMQFSQSCPLVSLLLSKAKNNPTACLPDVPVVHFLSVQHLNWVGWGFEGGGWGGTVFKLLLNFESVTSHLVFIFNMHFPIHFKGTGDTRFWSWVLL